MTTSQSSSIKLLEVHGMRKNLNPNLRPEKQHTLPKQGSWERLHVGQRRARSKRKRPDPINHAINQPLTCHRKLLEEQKQKTRKTNCMHSTDPTHFINNMDDRIANK